MMHQSIHPNDQEQISTAKTFDLPDLIDHNLVLDNTLTMLPMQK
jgi:hypothetical protein